MGAVLSWLQTGITITLAVWILVVPPMLLFRKLRQAAAVILMCSSYYTGFVCWWWSIIVCYTAFGGAFLSVGLLLGGIGVIPLAVFGTATHGIWPVFWDLILGVAFMIGPRILWFSSCIAALGERKLRRK